MSSCNTKNMANNIDKSKNLILHFCLLLAARFAIARPGRSDDIPPLFVSEEPIGNYTEKCLLRQP